MVKSSKSTVTLNRSSVTGRFVTSKYAQNHKNITVTEHRKKK